MWRRRKARRKLRSSDDDEHYIDMEHWYMAEISRELRNGNEARAQQLRDQLDQYYPPITDDEIRICGNCRNRTGLVCDKSNQVTSSKNEDS